MKFPNFGGSINLGQVVLAAANTATDGSGNVSSKSATITVQEKSVPVVKVKNVTIALDATGNGMISPSDIDGGSSDNCSFTLSIDKKFFTCANIGANAVSKGWVFVSEGNRYSVSRNEEAYSIEQTIDKTEFNNLLKLI